MTVAGTLLDTRPLHQREDYESNLTEWLKRHWLTRDDGRWLFDRRDARPSDVLVRHSEPEAASTWPHSVEKIDFDRVLRHGEGRFVLFGHWSSGTGSLEETVAVNSALVSPETGLALTRALQTMPTPYGYSLPVAGDSNEIDESSFQLRGWVDEETDSRRLDEFDGWGGKIRHPGIAPCQHVVELLQLRPDSERRQWFRGPELEMVSETWGTFHEADEEPSTSHEGRRLLVSTSLALDMLARLGMSLIVEVRINRRVVERYSGFDFSVRQKWHFS